MDKDIKYCDHCGLAVEVKGFELKTKQGDMRFCCEGCKGIYQMLHEALRQQGANDKSEPTQS